MSRRIFLGLGLLASSVLAEPIDNCASLLGSLSVELRVARALPADRRTTFVCTKDVGQLVGVSGKRILDSLGPPDVSAYGDGGGGATRWSYFFSSAHSGERGAGIPELAFSFDEQQQVSSVSCRLTRQL